MSSNALKLLDFSPEVSRENLEKRLGVVSNNSLPFKIDLKTEIYFSIEEKYHAEREGIIYFLNKGNTYQALEIAQYLDSRNSIPKWVITKIAYKHFLKMKNSNLDTKILNQLILMYPKMEYLK